MKLFHHSLTRSALLALIVSSVVLVVLWHVTTPSGSGPLGILFVFILIYIFFTSLVLLATGVWSLIGTRVFDRSALDGRRRYYVSSVLGFLPVLYLTLLSMGGASVWGIVLIFVFTGLMVFYVLRRTA